MTPGVFVFLLGLYGLPLVLLAWGHGLRRRSARLQRAFWGAIGGHLLAMLLALGAALSLPAAWSSTDVARGALGLWSLLMLPIGGALLGAVTSRSR
jgi:hypothetical protein